MPQPLYTDAERLRRIHRVLVMFYQENRSQAQIAVEMGLSTTTVNRMVREGHDHGLVEIRIRSPFEAEAGLASSLRLAGTGTMAPRWADLGTLTMPVLVVAGALDTKYVALAERLAAGIGPGARLEVVAAAGHTVHREQPRAFLAVLEPWLSAVADRGTSGPGRAAQAERGPATTTA